jgi:hypothetical protein
MQNKRRALDSVHWGLKRARDYYEQVPTDFDYGPVNKLAGFNGAHPKVMQERIVQMNWKDKLQYSGKPNPFREPHKHERLKYRLLSLIEKCLNGGEQIGGFKNYELLQV